MATQKNQRRSSTWQDIRPATRPRHVERQSPVVSKKTKPVSIWLSYLRISILKAYIVKLPKTKKNNRAIGISLLALGLIITGSYISSRPRSNGSDKSAPSQSKTDSPTLKKGTPEYPTVLPADKSIGDLGGWTRISPPNTDPVFTYTDKIGDQPINVSEQPLPEDFGPNPNERIQSIAEGFMANEKITVGTTIVYIGSSKQGAQSIIFTKNNLLILIKSTARINNTQLSEYINSLK